MAQKQLDDYLGREVAMKLWLEQLLGVTLEKDYWPQLSDGVILCDAMLEVKERSIPLVARPEEDGQQIAFFKAKKNIQFFLAACEEELFIPKRELFEVFDLGHLRNPMKVLHSLFWFANNAADSGWAPPVPKAIDDETFEKNANKSPARLVLITQKLRELQEERDARFRRMTLAQGSARGDRGRRGIGEMFPPPAAQEVNITHLSAAQMERIGKGIAPLQAVVRGNIARAAFKKIVRREAYRKNVAHEMHTTERTYFMNMKILQAMFLTPLLLEQEEVDFQKLATHTKLIFARTAELLELLDPRVTNWSHRQKVGDVFLKVAQELRDAYTGYVREYSPMIMTLVEARQNEKGSFTKVIKDIESSRIIGSIGLQLESYLIMPVQRVPRYVMLLSDMKKHTPHGHADLEDLEAAASAFGEVAAYINEKQREYEAVNKVVELKLKFGAEELENSETRIQQLVRPHRRYVAEENFCIVGKPNQQLWLYLLNDLLLCGKPKRTKKNDTKWEIFSVLRVRFIHTKLLENSGNRDFQIIEDSGGEVVLELSARSASVCTSWIETMKEAKLQLAALPVCEDEVSRERRPSLYKRALAEDNVSWAKPDIPDEIRALLAAENGDSSTEASPPASAAATPPTLAETPPTKSLPAVGSRKKRRLTRKQIRVISTVNDDELAQISAEEVEGKKAKRKSVMGMFGLKARGKGEKSKRGTLSSPDTSVRKVPPALQERSLSLSSVERGGQRDDGMSITRNRLGTTGTATRVQQSQAKSTAFSSSPSRSPSAGRTVPAGGGFSRPAPPRPPRLTRKTAGE